MNLNIKNAACCSCGDGCCDAPKNVEMNRKSIVIDFLYLDLTVCTRCRGTDTSLDEALSEVAKVLEATGVEVTVNKINVNSEELAIQHKFLSSPTIRINGRDIQMDIKESLCESCGDLCCDEVDCRVWVYQGKEYTVPPKAMIIEAILKEVYGGNLQEQKEVEYSIPLNLKNFYDSMKSKMKTLKIEWKHLDVEGETCDRCYDTGENLAQEVKRLTRALKPRGITVELIDTKLDVSQTPESNSILFNGVPIEKILDIEISNNYCESCSALVGTETYCRTVTFEGNEYEDVPAKAIRQAAYKALGLKEQTKQLGNTGCGCGGGNCC